MTIEQLLEKFEEIKSLAEDAFDCEDDPTLDKITAICEEVQLQYKIEQRLKDERD